MLLNLNLLLKFWHTPCLTIGDAFDSEFIAANVIACVANACMLFAGAVVELGWIEPKREDEALKLGFLPLLFAFAPSVVILGYNQSTHGLVVLFLTIVVW